MVLRLVAVCLELLAFGCRVGEGGEGGGVRLVKRRQRCA